MFEWSLLPRRGPGGILTMSGMLEACRDAAGSDARFVWVDEAFLVDRKVGGPSVAQRPRPRPGARAARGVEADGESLVPRWRTAAREPRSGLAAGGARPLKCLRASAMGEVTRSFLSWTRPGTAHLQLATPEPAWECGAAITHQPKEGGPVLSEPALPILGLLQEHEPFRLAERGRCRGALELEPSNVNPRLGTRAIPAYDAAAMFLVPIEEHRHTPALQVEDRKPDMRRLSQRECESRLSDGPDRGLSHERDCCGRGAGGGFCRPWSWP